MFTSTDIDAQDYILLGDGAPYMIYGFHLQHVLKTEMMLGG